MQCDMPAVSTASLCSQRCRPLYYVITSFLMCPRLLYSCCLSVLVLTFLCHATYYPTPFAYTLSLPSISFAVSSLLETAFSSSLYEAVSTAAEQPFLRTSSSWMDLGQFSAWAACGWSLGSFQIVELNCRWHW